MYFGGGHANSGGRLPFFVPFEEVLTKTTQNSVLHAEHDHKQLMQLRIASPLATNERPLSCSCLPQLAALDASDTSVSNCAEHGQSSFDRWSSGHLFFGSNDPALSSAVAASPLALAQNLQMRNNAPEFIVR